MRHTNRRISRSQSRAARLILAATGTLALGNQALAQQLYFDNNGASTGLGTGTGTWSAALINWATGTGGTPVQTWSAGATANFNVGFTVHLADAESLTGINFNTGASTIDVATGATGALLNFGTAAFSITAASAVATRSIIAAPIAGSGDMTIGIVNTAPTEIAGDMSQFTGNIYVKNNNASPSTTNIVDFQVNNNLGSAANTIYLDQFSRLGANNPGAFNGISTLRSTTISDNVVLNYNGVANATNALYASNGDGGTSTYGQSTFVAGTQEIVNFAGVISSPSTVNTNVVIGLGASGGRGTVVLSNQNTWTGNTQVTLGSNNGLLQVGIDNAFPTATVLTFGAVANTVAPMDLNGHSITLGGLATGTTANNNNGGGGADNGNIYNTSLTGTPNPATITIAGAANTTFAGDIGSTNLSVNPYNDNAPYVTGSATLGTAQRIVQASNNISLVINGPGSLTLAPVSNQQNGNEYTGNTTVNGGTLRLARTTTFAAGNAPGSVFTLSGGSNITVNGGTLSSAITTFGGAGNNYAGGTGGTITLNSSASLTPGGTGTTGVFSTGPLAVNAGSAISFDLTNANVFDQIFTSGLSLDTSSNTHTINLSLTSGGALVPGTYNLITGNISGDNPDPVTGAPSAFTLNTSTITTPDTFQLRDTGSALQLIVLAPALRWDPNGAGANSFVYEQGTLGSTGNWTEGSTFVNLSQNPQTEANWSNSAFSHSDVIIGNDVTQAGGPISLGENVTVGGKLTFGPIYPSAAGSPYYYSIIGSNTLTLAGGLAVNNAATLYNADGTVAYPAAEIDTPVVLAANQTWSVDPNQDFIVKGALTGNFALTKDGAGTLELDGASGSIGSLTVLAGIVQFGTASAIGSAPITLNGGGVIFYNLSGTLPNSLTIGTNGGQVGTTTGNTLTLSNNIVTANAFGVVGTGTVVLSGNNSFGTLDLFGGALQVSSAANFGNPAVVSTGTNTGVSTAINSTVPLTINGVISGGGNLVLNGADFTLAGANTIGQPGGPGTVGGAINLNTANQIVHVTNASGLGTGTTVIGTTPVTVEIDAPTVTSGSIRNNVTGSGVLHKTGTGIWILNGSAQANSATGGTITIDQGAIQINTLAALGGTNVTAQAGPDLVLNAGGALLLNLGGTRYSGNITLNGGTIARINNSPATGDFQFSTFNTDDATNLFNTTITVTANSVVDNQENTGTATASKDVMLEMPIVINSGATLTAQSEDVAPNHQKGTVIFRGVANDSTYAYMNVFLQPGATLMTAGVGEIDLGGTGRGDPIIGNGTPGNDSKLLLTSVHSFLRDQGSAVQNAGVTDMTRLVVNGTGSAGLRVEAAMNAVYVNLGDGTNDACTTGLFGTNTVSAPNGNAFTVLSPARAAALSNPYTLVNAKVVNPQGTLTLAATDASGATGVINTGPAAAIPLALALDNTSTSGNLIYQLDGSAATTGVKLLNFSSGITLERSNSSAGTVLGQLKSNTHIASLTLLNSTTFDLVNRALELESSTNISTYLSSAAIFSSTVNADANHITTIAQVSGAQLGLTGSDTLTLQGITFDASSLLLKAAYYGDVNLDGRINADDYALIDRSVAKGLAANWIDGDFNNDGLVNSADYMLMDRAFAISNGSTLSPAFLAQRESQFGPEYVSALVAAVPEPSGVLGSVLGVLVPYLRRRRR